MSKCAICSEKTARKPSVSCAGVCALSFHAACVNIPTETVPLLTSVKGLNWRCASCLAINDYQKQSQKCIEEKFELLIADFTEKFSQLKGTLLEEISNKIFETSSKSDDNSKSFTPVSFADTVRKDKSRIILRPKDHSQKNSETKQDLFDNINQRIPDLNIKKVKHLNNGGILLGCGNESDTSKVKEIAEEKLSKKYEIRVLKELHPRVRIVGMTQKLDPEKLTSWLKKQNRDIFENGTLEVLRICPTKKKNDVYQATLQVDEKVYRKVMLNRSIIIGLDTCKVYEAFSLTRCFKCNGLNHSSKSCEGDLTCPLCAENHALKDCQVRNPNHYKCSNCLSVKQKQNSKINVKHAAWDYSSCHFYKQALERFKNEIVGPQ